MQFVQTCEWWLKIEYLKLQQVEDEQEVDFQRSDMSDHEYYDLMVESLNDESEKLQMVMVADLSSNWMP